MMRAWDRTPSVTLKGRTFTSETAYYFWIGGFSYVVTMKWDHCKRI